MIKYLKKLWKKFFGKTLKARPENVGEEIATPTPTPKPLHCANHTRFKKSCPTCQEVIK